MRHKVKLGELTDTWTHVSYKEPGRDCVRYRRDDYHNALDLDISVAQKEYAYERVACSFNQAL